MPDYSVSPEGEKFAIPEKDEYAEELKRIESLVEAAGSEGKEIVVVMGVGFVGAVKAAIIADAVDKKTGRITSSSSAVNGQVPEATGRFRCLTGGCRRLRLKTLRSSR